MGFSLLRWRNSGRSWSRGEPPPRGSVEYCGVPEVFQPPPRAASSSGAGVPTPTAAKPPAPTPAAARPPAPTPTAARSPAPTPTPTDPPGTGGGSGVLWLLGAAGAAYLGARWLESRGRLRGDEVVPRGDVVVLHPGDEVVVGGDGETERVYNPEDLDGEET